LAAADNRAPSRALTGSGVERRISRGSWWAAFAKCDRVFDGEVYGDTDNT
jgi:hypothetical protein